LFGETGLGVNQSELTPAFWLDAGGQFKPVLAACLVVCICQQYQKQPKTVEAFYRFFLDPRS